MAQVSWPSDKLGDEMFLPITQTRKDARVRTEMESGPPKMRRRTTAAVEPVTVTLRFTGEELNDFHDFYTDTIDEGTQRFEWTNPMTSNTVDFRVGQQGFPEFTMIRGGSGDSGLWQAEWQINIQPTVV